MNVALDVQDYKVLVELVQNEIDWVKGDEELHEYGAALTQLEVRLVELKNRKLGLGTVADEPVAQRAGLEGIEDERWVREGGPKEALQG